MKNGTRKLLALRLGFSWVSLAYLLYCTAASSSLLKIEWNSIFGELFFNLDLFGLLKPISILFGPTEAISLSNSIDALQFGQDYRPMN
jgi:hypothetical protein